MMFKKKPKWEKKKEASIEKYLIQKVKEYNGLCYKFVSPGQRDVPDRICIFPNGRLIFVEVKRPGETVRTTQMIEINKLLDYGQLVIIVSTKEEVECLINMVCS